MKVNVPPDRGLPVTIHTDGVIARCQQKTGVRISLDFSAGSRCPGAVVPSVKGMTGRARQIADMDLLPMVVEDLDVACGLIVEREDIIDQFPFWMGRHRGNFVFRRPAL